LEHGPDPAVDHSVRTPLGVLEMVADFVHDNVLLLKPCLHKSGIDQGCREGKRNREVFPVPLLSRNVEVPGASCHDEQRVAAKLANATLIGLNSLYGVSADQARATPSSSQRSVQRNVLQNVISMIHGALDVQSVLDGSQALDLLLTGASPTQPCSSNHIVADSFDLLERSAGVDPMPCLPEKVRNTIVGEPGIMQGAHAGLNKFPGIKNSDRPEYAKLVAKQLLCGKVSLALSIRGGGTVFGVGKKNSGKLREVWHGARVSAAALKPPKPPHLASPSALLDLECSLERPLRLSKRDGRCLFDQLLLPSELRQWMGRPPVRVRELLCSGLVELEQLQTWCDAGVTLHSHTLVFPVSCVWPMGFSRSSFIAQSKMLHVCFDAGLNVQRILAEDVPSPASFEETFALATDDVLHFCRGPASASVSAMAKLDRAFIRHGVLKHEKKDSAGELNGTCIGVDLQNGTRFMAHANKLITLLSGLCEVLRRQRMTPADMQAMQGHIQWFDLLNRPLFAILDEVYGFARLDNPNQERAIPDVPLSELMLVLALASFWQADLTREWLPEITACDASPQFGFGVCFAPCSIEMAKAVGRLAEKRGDYVRLDRDEFDTEAEKPRLGVPHRRGLKKSSFHTVVSARKQYNAHSGALEATGVLHLIRWLLRSPRKHNHRVVALVDAKAVLGAVAKGRSSANTLKREVRRVAALTLAGNFLMRYVYVPSEDNPADAPSRGLKRRHRPNVSPIRPLKAGGTSVPAMNVGVGLSSSKLWNSLFGAPVLREFSTSLTLGGTSSEPFQKERLQRLTFGKWWWQGTSSEPFQKERLQHLTFGKWRWQGAIGASRSKRSVRKDEGSKAAESTSWKHGLAAWMFLMAVALDFSWGSAAWPDMGSARAGQCQALSHLESAAERFMSERFEEHTARSPSSDYGAQLKGVRMNYVGEVSGSAETVTLDQVSSALPPEGCGGISDVMEHVDDVKGADLLDPSRSKLDSPEGTFPRTQVMVKDQTEWEAICHLLLQRGVAEEIAESAIARWKGRLVLAGCFGVRKAGKFLADGRPVLRLIIDMRASNWLFRSIVGDVASLTGSAGWQSMRIGADTVVLTYGEDLSCAFYLFRLPAVWRPFMALARPVSRRKIGLAGDGLTYLASRVLPMGWISAVGVMQNVGRMLVSRMPPAGAGIPVAAEVRRGALATAGERTWSVYLDDLTIFRRVAMSELSVLSGQTDRWQRLMRAVYDSRNIPWAPAKSVTGSEACERLGGLFDGVRGFLGPTVTRSLTIIGLGLWIISKGRLRRLPLRIFAGREVHCLQFRRALFAFYGRLWQTIGGSREGSFLSLGLMREMLVSFALMPLRGTSLHSPLDGLASCSDASEWGGGICSSTGLSEAGVAECEELRTEHPEVGPFVSELACANTARLLLAFLRRAEYRGSDIRMDINEVAHGASWPRCAIPANRWKWQVVKGDHVRPFIGLSGLLRPLRKGRSSSLVLNSTLRRTSALTLAANFYPLLGYVHTSENPSDEPSRRFERKRNNFKVKTRPVDVGLRSAETASEKVGSRRKRKRSPGGVEQGPEGEAEKRGGQSGVVDQLWENGDGKAAASYTLAGLQFLQPKLKKHLPGAWKLLAAWQKLELPAGATPATPLVAFGVAGCFAAAGQFRMGLLIVLAFAIFLQTGEIFQLQNRDVTFSKDGLVAVLSLRDTKGSKRSKVQQTERITVEDPAAVACPHWLCEGKAEGERLSSLSSNEFRGLWVKAIKALGLQGFHYPPYCLRRGGATRMFRLTRSLDVCCAIGRWQDIRT
ncbi:unnamed protein product, partial [Polarella glacialis]